MKVSLEDSDLDAIAARVVAALKAEGGRVTEKPSTKPATKNKPATKPKPEEPEPGTEEHADDKVLTVDDVTAKLKTHKEANGMPATMAILNKYGKNVGSVKPEDYGALIAELDGAEPDQNADEPSEDPFA